MISTDTLFHCAAHSARDLMVKYQQQAIVIEEWIDRLEDKLAEIPKAERKTHPWKQQLIQLKNELSDAERQAEEWKQAYKQAVALY